jgi:hypothetical protein
LVTGIRSGKKTERYSTGKWQNIQQSIQTTSKEKTGYKNKEKHTYNDLINVSKAWT